MLLKLTRKLKSTGYFVHKTGLRRWFKSFLIYKYKSDQYIFGIKNLINNPIQGSTFLTLYKNF